MFLLFFIAFVLASREFPRAGQTPDAYCIIHLLTRKTVRNILPFATIKYTKDDPRFLDVRVLFGQYNDISLDSFTKSEDEFMQAIYDYQYSGDRSSQIFLFSSESSSICKLFKGLNQILEYNLGVATWMQ